MYLHSQCFYFETPNAEYYCKRSLLIESLILGKPRANYLRNLRISRSTLDITLARGISGWKQCETCCTIKFIQDLNFGSNTQTEVLALVL